MWDPHSYLIASHLFIRLLGFIYFVASGSFFLQILGLIGEDGILPLKEYLSQYRNVDRFKRWYWCPSLFWINASDTALLLVNGLGVAASLLLLLGYFPTVNLVILYIIWLSLVFAGQEFMSFGWEMFLLEMTFNAIFLSITAVPNWMIWISLNFLIFRFHVQAGIVKLQTRDVSWKNLTALYYHYFTQPIPNTWAWYIQKMPLSFHKVSCILMFVIELPLPLLVFGTQEMRLAAWIGFISLQFFIWLTGNFSYLNYMTAALCTILLSDTYLAPIFGTPAAPVPTPLWLNVFLSLIGAALLVLQLLRFWIAFFSNHTISKILGPTEPYHIANRYGIFAIMTTKRYEVVIEGSDDGSVWKEYLFQYKPSELNRRPRRISPYQPRLDWQAWFLPFSPYGMEKWFIRFLTCLLQSKKPVLRLLRHNPFPENPPKYVRALLYDYEYTSWKEKNETGNWWKRELQRPYSPVLHLKKEEP